MKLLVVGAGEMGRWVADTVDAAVAFTDADADVAADAAAAREARRVPTTTDEFFEVVCLAVPMSAVEEAVDQYAPLATEAIFDVSGVMADPIDAMEVHASDLERASFHPLFAPPRVPGNVAVVTGEDGPHLQQVREAMTDAGNTVFETTPEEHDSAMETVQAGAHTAVLAYALAADSVREEFATPVSERLEAVATTVTEGDPAVYAEIQSTFDGAESVADAARTIAEADDTQFAELYNEAKDALSVDGRERHE
ncbi:prephenate dehydrogenase/arogenate dehydrogenase family protein [Halohasta salina]|uniref:prephenate dehydrogenase/arogenate dehydrogenase family protein n=1 Tax=Halohasta salina TaxID=2961621 RepID=UPI0020A3E776|nr:prephenate dehydrogenase/arogenate dehydrogenase family protein [Halohasta salina]